MEIPKEPGPYAHFSLIGGAISDLMNPYSGYYKFPTPGFYGPYYPHGDLVWVVQADGSQVQIPEFIHQEIQNAPEQIQLSEPPSKKNPEPRYKTFPKREQISFYWIVSDISLLRAKKGNVMNLVQHGWAFPGFVEGRETKDIPSWIFPEEGVAPLEQRSVSFTGLRSEFLSCHFKKNMLSLSPNNHRFLVESDSVAKFWTLSYNDMAPEAIVTYQWLIIDPHQREMFTDVRYFNELRPILDIWNI